MSSRRKKPLKPHHIFAELDAGAVGALSIRRGMNQVEIMSPDTTLEEIRKTTRANHGPGRFRLVPMDVGSNNPLTGYYTYEIDADIQDAGDGFGIETSMPVAFLSEQQRQIREERLRIEAKSNRLESDREGVMDELLIMKRQTQDEQLGVMAQFLDKQAEYQTRLEEKKLELEAASQAREADRKREHEASMAGIEAKKLELENQLAVSNRAEFEMKLEQERKLFEMKLEQALQQNQMQLELQKKELALERERVDIEAKKRDDELSKKYGLSSEAGLPKEVFEELAWRRLNEEYPEKSDLEKVVEKYIDPIFSLIQARDPNFKKRLADAMPGNVSSPETPSDDTDFGDEVVFSSRDFQPG